MNNGFARAWSISCVTLGKRKYECIGLYVVFTLTPYWTCATRVRISKHKYNAESMIQRVRDIVAYTRTVVVWRSSLHAIA